jgi:hypothetical protein
MNERIRELIRQAGTDCSGKWMGMNHAEKFAELIIKECLDQCYNRGMNDELYAGQLKAAEYIEEYFGVNQ